VFLLTILLSSASADLIHFAISNPAAIPVTTVVRVSLPIPRGRLVGAPPSEVVLDGKAVPVQARVITRHPDGSIRRVMLSVPAHLEPRGVSNGIYPSGEAATPAAEQAPAVIPTDRWKVLPKKDRIELRGADNVLLATIEPFGPEPGQAEGAVQVLDCGTQFAWLRHDRAGREWNRQWDVQVLRTGELRLTHRIQAKMVGDHWTPEFGWKVLAPGARAPDPAKGAAQMLGRDPNSRFSDKGNADLLAQITLGDGVTACFNTGERSRSIGAPMPSLSGLSAPSR